MLFTAIFVLILAILVPLAIIPRFLPSLLPQAAMSFAPAAATAAYARELYIAQLAVQRAAILTKRVFNEKAKGTVDRE